MLRLLYVLTDLIAPLAVGYVLKQRHLVKEKSVNRLIKINVVGVYTVLSLLSFWVLPLSFDLVYVPFFGFFLVLFPGAIGYLLFARHIRNLRDRGAYLNSAMLSNLGTLGGVCAFILYQETGFAYAQIIGTCQNILLALVVFPLSQYYHLKDTDAGAGRPAHRHSFREIFFSINQLSLLGMTAGILLNAGGIARPPVLAPLFQSLVHIGAWTAMLPVGFLIDFRTAHRYLPHLWSLNALRFLVMPLSVYALASLVISDPVLKGTILILACCPTAINAVIACQLYQLNVGLAAASFLITTILYLALIFPALFFFLH